MATSLVRLCMHYYCHLKIILDFSYSALKKDGQRMSVLLKKGHKVEAKPARSVTVYKLTLQEFNPPLFTLGSHMHKHIQYHFLPLCSIFLTVFLPLQTLNVEVDSMSEVWWMTWEQVCVFHSCDHSHSMKSSILIPVSVLQLCRPAPTSKSWSAPSRVSSPWIRPCVRNTGRRNSSWNLCSRAPSQSREWTVGPHRTLTSEHLWIKPPTDHERTFSSDFFCCCCYEPLYELFKEENGLQRIAGPIFLCSHPAFLFPIVVYCGICNDYGGHRIVKDFDFALECILFVWVEFSLGFSFTHNADLYMALYKTDHTSCV